MSMLKLLYQLEEHCRQIYHQDGRASQSATNKSSMHLFRCADQADELCTNVTR